MIGDDAKRDVDPFRIAFASSSMFRKGRLVFLAAECFQLVEDRAKNVGLVVRDCAGESSKVFCALNDRGCPLETQPSIDVTLGEWDIFDTTGVSDPGYRLRVELDENEIPNLDTARVVFVHEPAAGVAVRRKVDM